MIIDFDLKDNNLHSVFGAPELSKDMKRTIKKIEEDENKLEEKDISKLIVKVDKNIDLISSTKIVFNEEYIINKEKIKEMFENLKYSYDLILIDTSEDSKYFELNKVLNEISNKTICLIQGNLIYLKKTMKLLEETICKKDNTFIVCNKYSKYSINRKILEFIFFKYKVIGVLNYDESYEDIINKSVTYQSISENIKNNFGEIFENLGFNLRKG